MIENNGVKFYKMKFVMLVGYLDQSKPWRGLCNIALYLIGHFSLKLSLRFSEPGEFFIGTYWMIEKSYIYKTT